MGCRSVLEAEGVAVGGAACQHKMAARTVLLFSDYLAWGIQPCMYLPPKTDSPTRTVETHT